jgi:predicted glycosyltransferase involved in capsule biosynthesis
LLRQTDKNFDVVVADDGSQPQHRQRILEAAVSQTLGLTHVWHPDVGFTASKVRNRGVLLAKSNYVLLLDGDCVPEQDFIARQKVLAEPGFFMNGSRVLLSPVLTQNVENEGEQVDGRSTFYWLGQRLRGRASKLSGLIRLPDWRGRINRDFIWKGIRSCNIGVWKRDFERVDGFDESFVGWGHEDADFVLRLHHAGIARKNGFCATEVYHLWHTESSRADESSNANVVSQRVKTGIIRATLGYSQQRSNDNAVITRLG